MEAVMTDLTRIIAPPHTAVVVIDMQNDFCDEKGSLGQRGIDIKRSRAVIPRLKKLLDGARQKKIPVVLIRLVRTEENTSAPMRELGHRHGKTWNTCLQGSWGAELIPELSPQPGDIVIEKARHSAFIGTDLETRLRGMGIKTLIVTGVTTNVCVEATTRHGFMLDFYIIIPGDLVACSRRGLQKRTLDFIDHNLGIVTSQKEILQRWGTS